MPLFGALGYGGTGVKKIALAASLASLRRWQT
jgi:hypothetical protein